MDKKKLIGILCVLLALATLAAVQQHVAFRRLAAQVEMHETQQNKLKAARPELPPDASVLDTRRQTDAAKADSLNASQNIGTASESEDNGTPAGSLDARRERRTSSQTPESADRRLAENAGDGTAYSHSNVLRSTSGRSAAPGARSHDTTPLKEREKHSTETAAQAAERSKALSVRAQQLMREGDYTTAEELLQQSLELDIENSRSWRQMAQLQRQLGMTDVEIGTYQQWMDTLPNDAEPYYLLAEAYARLGMDGEARNYLAAYEGMASGTMGEYMRMSELYRRMNARDDEGRVLTQWMTTAPESMDARRAWADYQRRAGNYGAALAQYEMMAATMPDNPLPHRQMAEIYRRNGDYATAQQHYETALAMRPDDIPTMNRLADVLYTSGDLHGALNVYAEIMTLEPGSRAAEQAERRAAQIQRQLQR